MNFDLATALRFLQAVGPTVAAVPAVARTFEQAIAALKGDDQKQAKEAYADLIADNDDGHRRIQEKLEKAAKR